jgi:hypothetical protein
MTEIAGDLNTAILDILETVRAVNIGFARAQQIEIGAVN